MDRERGKWSFGWWCVKGKGAVRSTSEFQRHPQHPKHGMLGFVIIRRRRSVGNF